MIILGCLGVPPFTETPKWVPEWTTNFPAPSRPDWIVWSRSLASTSCSICGEQKWVVFPQKKTSSTLRIIPIGSMGLVYLPTSGLICMVNVGKYTIHWASGLENHWTLQEKNSLTWFDSIFCRGCGEYIWFLRYKRQFWDPMILEAETLDVSNLSEAQDDLLKWLWRSFSKAVDLITNVHGPL